MPAPTNRPPADSAVLQQKFLTVAELAATMRVSKMTIYRAVNLGDLEAVRHGRTIRIPEAAAAAYLRSNGGDDA